MSTIDQAEAEAIINANKQAEIRAFDTHAKLSLPEVDPLEMQLLAHFRACSEKGRKLIALHAASVASLCIAYKKEG
jgi:hypothetical protein